MKEVVDKLVEWLRSSVKEANCKGIVYGLSGGVDSAVIAALSKLAFDDESLAIMMPINSCEEDEKDAKLVIDKFKLNAIKVDLSKTYSVFTDSVEKGDNSMAYANIKPRLRMTTLYYYAQLKGYLVVGTSNKSEFTVGYFTKQRGELVELVGEPVTTTPVYFVFRKESEDLKNRVNKALSEMKADGTLTKISEKWFGSDFTK